MTQTVFTVYSMSTQHARCRSVIIHIGLHERLCGWHWQGWNRSAADFCSWAAVPQTISTHTVRSVHCRAFGLRVGTRYDRTRPPFTHTIITVIPDQSHPFTVNHSIFCQITTICFNYLLPCYLRPTLRSPITVLNCAPFTHSFLLRVRVRQHADRDTDSSFLSVGLSLCPSRCGTVSIYTNAKNNRLVRASFYSFFSSSIAVSTDVNYTTATAEMVVYLGNGTTQRVWGLIT